MVKRKRKPMRMLIAVVMLFAIGMMAGCNGYRRHSNSDERIEVQLENKIRRDFSASNDDASFRHTYISTYFGTYNGASAVIIGFRGQESPAVLRHTVVGGVDFGYTGVPFITVWHEGSFLQLASAFEEGLLTVDNLEAIRQYWQPFYISNND